MNSSSDQSQRSLHITIGTAVADASINLEHDLRLVKAALLYADSVKLCSLKSTLVTAVLQLGEMKPREQVLFLEMVAPTLVQDKQLRNLLTVIEQYKETYRPKILEEKGSFRFQGPTQSDLHLRYRLERVISQSWVGIKERIDEIAKAAGAEGINRAKESGLLTLHSLGETGNFDDIVTEFLDVIAKSVSNGSTYPLFDEQTSGLVRAGIEEGKITVSGVGIDRSKHSRLAAHLFERLPLFDAASVDEILDIRKELERPLVRFQAAMMKFSDDIRSAAWDKDFDSEAQQVFYREIEPAVLDIEDAVKTNRFFAALVRKIADKPLALPAGSTLAAVMSQLSSLPDLVSQALGVSLAAAPLVYDASKEWKDKKLKSEQNHLFFYYRARKELSE